MSLQLENVERRGEKCLQVTGYEGTVRDLVIPETSDGLPIRSIGGHAFAGRRDLRSVVLPQNLKTIRSFAFYDCAVLSHMELYNTTDDYYDGVIRQCPELRSITVHCVKPDDYVIVREMLQDVDVTLRFRLLTEQGELRLTFPEYVSEAREDTMARAIHFSIEGAGMAYRECVGKKSLDLAGYDQLLPRLTDYDFAVAADIALGRLGYPLGLTEEAAKGYEEFLRRHDARALELMIRQDEAENRVSEVKLMADRNLIGSEALAQGLELASQKGRVEISAVLMNYREGEKPAGNPDGFQLEW